MKKQLLSILICGTICLAANAQTNTFPSSGNVGIGTNTPQAALDINGTIQISGIPSGTPPSDLSYGLFHYSGIGLGIFSGAIGANQGIGIWTNPNGVNKEVMRISSGGNVGIGTSNPTNHIDIQAQPRTGTHATGRPFYVTGDIGQYSNGFEFRHSNGTQGIGFGYNSIYATGTNADQNLNLIPRGNGNVGIGTANPTYKLDVIGTIRSREVKVDMNGADFVFENDYKLMPLNDLEKYLQKEKHLPEIASAREMETNGTDLGALNSKLLQKLEELTLYIIEMNKRNELQDQEIKKLHQQINKNK